MQYGMSTSSWGGKMNTRDCILGKWVALGFICLMGVDFEALAAGGVLDASSAKELYNKLYDTNEVPNTPAFVVLGLDPSSASVASDFKSLSAAVSQIVSQKNSSAAMGVSFNPFKIYRDNKISSLAALSGSKDDNGDFENEKNSVVRISKLPLAVQRLQVSLGQATGDLAGVKNRRALGVFSTIYDGDNGVAFSDCQKRLEDKRAKNDFDGWKNNVTALIKQKGDAFDVQEAYRLGLNVKLPGRLFDGLNNGSVGLLPEEFRVKYDPLELAKFREGNKNAIGKSENEALSGYRDVCHNAVSGGYTNSLSVGYAVGDGVSSDKDQGVWLGSAIWVSGSYGFGERLQYIKAAEDLRESVPINLQQLVLSISKFESVPSIAPAGTAVSIYRVDKVDAAFTYRNKVRVLSAAEKAGKNIGDVQAVAQISGGWIKPELSDRHSSRRYLVGGEFEIPLLGGWFVFTAGREAVTADGKWTPVGQMAFKYGFSEKPLF